MSKTISKKMLINVMHPEEARVAIVHDGRLMELNIEITGKEQTKGNIYKGVVLRVEPGLQAAFVDIGRAKPGFLQMGELHPDFWQWRDDVPEDQRKRRPRIQEVLRRGQELLVQVEKDERDHKGSALGLPAHGPGSLASVGQRLAATLIDGLLFVPLSILLYVTRTTHQEARAVAGGVVVRR